MNYIKQVKKYRKAVEKWLASVPNPPDWYYWKLPFPPKDKIPKPGEVWMWTYTWGCGTVEQYDHTIVRIKGKMWPKIVDQNGEVLTLRKVGGDSWVRKS